MPNYNAIFQEFGVKTEDELSNLLMEQSGTLPCIECGEEFDIDVIKFIDDNPVCPNCIKRFYTVRSCYGTGAIDNL